VRASGDVEGAAGYASAHVKVHPSSSPRGVTAVLTSAHARFAKAALAIYVGVAALAVALLVVTLASDLSHDEGQLQQQLVLQTDVRARALAQHLDLLVKELERLGRRAEVDTLDENIAPERRLLELSHKKSTFFNVGVAVIGQDGAVLWGEPEGFLPSHVRLANEPWFTRTRDTQLMQIVPIAPDRADSLFYLVSPILRGGQFAGALLGAIDIARSDAMRLDGGSMESSTALVMPEGTVVYPAIPPPYSREPAWLELCATFGAGPTSLRPWLQGERMILASAPVAGTDLQFVSFVPERELFAQARKRMHTRVAWGLWIALAPLGLLVWLLWRSLRVFRRSEEHAVHEEHLRRLGEASNLIAHEVRNGLNGLSMGLDLIVANAKSTSDSRARITREMRQKISQLRDFTTGLMSFSTGIVPRSIPVDLGQLVIAATALTSEAAAELNTVVEVDVPTEPLVVRADPTLTHVVVANVLGNAIDAVTGLSGDAPGRIHVSLRASGAVAELRISDSGPGVAPAMLDRLFEPFQTGKPSGVGIGLALSKKIALAHGGDLSLTKDEAHSPYALPGACFLLTLPIEVLS
jgi:two-component system C4-dicarboxylate transport sensor histidine kinase DctB